MMKVVRSDVKQKRGQVMPIVMDDSIIRYGPPLNNQFKMASMKQRVFTSPLALTGKSSTDFQIGDGWSLHSLHLPS